MPSFHNLPAELFLDITQHLELCDKARLSAVSPFLRSALAPEVFRTVRLTNDEAVARSALAAVEKYGQHTTRLEFQGSAGPADELKTPALPAAASELLRGRRTPNLHTVQIKFMFDFDNSFDDDAYAWDDHPSCSMGFTIYVFESVEDADWVRKKEGEKKWRALMNETWQALVCNERVRELVVEDLIPKWTSTFQTDGFRHFLGRLESATLRIYSGCNGAGWTSNSVGGGYLDFLDKLNYIFFRHMSKLKHLSLCATDGGPLGSYDLYRASPLNKAPDGAQESLPQLQSLKLEYYFADPDLVSFLNSHAKVLRSLELKNCVAEAADGEISPYPWARFFDKLLEAGPALTDLIVDCDREDILRDDDADNCPDEDDDAAIEDDATEARRMLAADPHLLVFNYSSCSPKYGSLDLYEGLTVEKLVEGEDQLAYNRLMAVVKQNAAREQRADI